LTTLAQSLQESTSLAKVVKSVLTPEMNSYLIYNVLSGVYFLDFGKKFMNKKIEVNK